jgi:phage gp36-like protein
MQHRQAPQLPTLVHRSHHSCFPGPISHVPDSTSFDHQMTVAALRGADDAIVNYIGTHYRVSVEQARQVSIRIRPDRSGGGEGKMMRT